MRKPKDGTIIWRLLLVLAAVIWGASFFVMKGALDDLPVCYLLGIRFTTGAVLLALVYLKRMLAHLDWGHVWRGSMMGVFLFAAYWVQTIGLTQTTPGKNAFLTAGYCVIVPFLNWAYAHDRPTLSNLVAAFLLVLGVGFVSLTGDLSIGYGDLMTMLCAFFYAAHIVCTSCFTPNRDIFVLTVCQFAAAAVLAWAISLFTETPPPASVWSGELIRAMLYLAVCATTLALLFQNIGVKHTHPAVASILLSLESVFGVLFSVLFAGEQLTLKLVIGFTLIFVAVIVSETNPGFLRLRRREQAVVEASGAMEVSGTDGGGVPGDR